MSAPPPTPGSRFASKFKPAATPAVRLEEVDLDSKTPVAATAATTVVASNANSAVSRQADPVPPTIKPYVAPPPPPPPSVPSKPGSDTAATGGGGSGGIPNEPQEDSEDEEDPHEPEETMEEQKSIKKMPKIGYLLLDLFMAFLMLVPFIVLKFTKDFPVYNILLVKAPFDALNPYMEFFRWSLFCSIAFASYGLLDFALGAVPTHLLNFFNRIGLFKSKKVRRQVGYLRNIHPYVTASVFFLVLLWLGGLIVYDSNPNAGAIRVGPLGAKPAPLPAAAAASPASAARTAANNAKAANNAAKGGAAAAAGTTVTVQRIPPGSGGFFQDTKYFIERFLILAAIVSGAIALEKYMLEAIRAKFHRMALSVRIRDINKRQDIIRKLYESVTKGQPHIMAADARAGQRGEDIYLDIDPVLKLSSVSRAKSVATTIFNGICTSSRRVIIKDDIKSHLVNEDPDEAFKILDVNDNGEIDEEEMREVMIVLYDDLVNIHASLKGNARIVAKLDGIFLIIAILVGLALSMPFFDVGIGRAWATFGVISTAFGFMFQNAGKTCFEALIFVFVEHAYDVGDRVTVDGENMVVQNIEIFTTRFVRWDGLVTYIPNSVLSGKFIFNSRRSGMQSDPIVAQIAAKTTTEQLRQVLAKIKERVSEDAKSFSGFVDISEFTVLDEQKMEVKFTVQYKSNFQNQAIRNARKSKFNGILKDVLAELGIEYYPAA